MPLAAMPTTMVIPSRSAIGLRPESLLARLRAACGAQHNQQHGRRRCGPARASFGEGDHGDAARSAFAVPARRQAQWHRRGGGGPHDPAARRGGLHQHRAAGAPPHAAGTSGTARRAVSNSAPVERQRSALFVVAGIGVAQRAAATGAVGELERVVPVHVEVPPHVGREPHDVLVADRVALDVADSVDVADPVPRQRRHPGG